MKKQNARLTVTFENGSARVITLKKVIVIDTSGKQELSFRETSNGEWVMAVTKSMLESKQLAQEFLAASKIPE